ncbi:hypothetical protein AAFC00_002962 [Neodothiora populina]|uniref:Ubiquitin-like 1-activating enzyme E1A n=1 Tax=Neodothiora populina TaxID=2781224 RepID=A0ABR3P979_9PEZI
MADLPNGSTPVDANVMQMTLNPAVEAVGTAAHAQAISADEIALYDRQIRLWGVAAQEKIRSANILLISIKALGNEIAKNVILNGIGSLTILDGGVVTEDDLGAQYFLREEDIGRNRAEAATPRLQELNPRVKVTTDKSDILSKGPDYYALFDLVIACDLDFLTTTQVNAGCRIAQKPFYAAGLHGFYGYIFADLIQHEYIIEREKSNVATVIKAESTTRMITNVATKRENGKNIELVTKREIYSPLLLANTSPLPIEYIRNRRKMRSITPLLPALRALWDFERKYSRMPSHSKEDLIIYTSLANEKLLELQMPPETLKADFLRSFLQNIGSELVPVAAFVGGRLSEDVINVLGKREQPLQNMAFFDGENFEGPIYALHPIFPEDTAALTATANNPPSNNGVSAMNDMAPIVL